MKVKLAEPPGGTTISVTISVCPHSFVRFGSRVHILARLTAGYHHSSVRRRFSPYTNNEQLVNTWCLKGLLTSGSVVHGTELRPYYLAHASTTTIFKNKMNWGGSLRYSIRRTLVQRETKKALTPPWLFQSL